MASGLMPSSQLDQLIVALQESQTVRLSQFASVTWLVYDIVIQSKQEFELIWRSPWSVPKCLYLVARYFGLFFSVIYFAFSTATTLSIVECRFWVFFAGFGGPVVFATTVNAIFVLRLNALYGGNRKVLALMVVLTTVDFSVGLFVTIKQALETAISPSPLPGFVSCDIVVMIQGSFTLYAWVFSIVTTTTFFTLTMIKCYQAVGSPSSIKDFRQFYRGDSSPLYRVFIRDGSLFFAILNVVLVFCLILCVAYWGTGYGQMGISWLAAAYSFTGSRILLNMRVAGRVAPHGLTALGPLSEIEFEERSTRQVETNVTTPH